MNYIKKIFKNFIYYIADKFDDREHIIVEKEVIKEVQVDVIKEHIHKLEWEYSQISIEVLLNSPAAVHEFGLYLKNKIMQMYDENREISDIKIAKEVWAGFMYMMQVGTDDRKAEEEN